MKSIFIIIFTVLTVSNNIIAQEINFFGEFEQGTLVIAQGDPVEWARLNDQELKIDDSGIFTFGFDRNEPDTMILNVKFKEGKVLLKKIKMHKRQYKIQHINNMKKELVTAPKDLNQRIKKERQIALEARRPIGKIDTAFYKVGFIRPVKGGRVSSVFGSARILNGIPKNAHNGYDIAAPIGTSVYAMTDGIVRLAADNFYYPGNYILLDHGQGLNSQYLHLSKMIVKKGDRVKKGQKIGEIGTTGRSTGPHLHWGVQWYLRRIDPARLLELDFAQK